MAALDNQFAIVTGGGGGIGSAICQALACHGGMVWAVGRTESKLMDTAERCRGRARACVADLDDAAQVERLASDAAREHGRLDVLVHAAGTLSPGAIADSPVELLDAHYRTNLRLHYSVTRALLPLLRTKGGSIVFINSSIVHGGARPELGQYAATQHAARAFADTLRQEVNADGIRVLSVFPGRTATSMQAGLYARAGRAYQPELLLQPHDIAAMVTAVLALPPTAEVTDISMRSAVKSY